MHGYKLKVNGALKVSRCKISEAMRVYAQVHACKKI